MSARETFALPWRGALLDLLEGGALPFDDCQGESLMVGKRCIDPIVRPLFSRAMTGAWHDIAPSPSAARSSAPSAAAA